jgi:hypothetical protein
VSVEGIKLNKNLLIVLAFLVLWTVLTVLGVTWGTRFDWPDNVHVDYGFPLVWSTQTLNTIIGPVNLWTVDITALMMNLVFWLGTMLAVTLLVLYTFDKKLPSD